MAMTPRAWLVIALLPFAGAAIAAEDAAQTLEALDSDGDGRISATEYTASPGKTRREFTRIDRDGDGYLSMAEIGAYRKTMKESEEAEEEEG
jgi:Ca2+-binding EF-hand superfamily protein